MKRARAFARALRLTDLVYQTLLTRGPFGTEPLRGGEPPPPPGPPLPPGGFRRGDERRFLARRGSGSFSGRGNTGPSGYSNESLLLPFSSVITTTRT